MRFKILATRIDLPSDIRIGNSERSQGLSDATPRFCLLSVLSFKTDEYDSIETLYSRLRAGESIGISGLEIRPFERESESLLLAEFPLRLIHASPPHTHLLSMP